MGYRDGCYSAPEAFPCLGSQSDLSHPPHSPLRFPRLHICRPWTCIRRGNREQWALESAWDEALALLFFFYQYDFGKIIYLFWVSVSVSVKSE